MLFRSYNDANGVFDLSEYYRTATQSEVDQFSNNPAFEISDADTFARSVAGISMRKKIAKIIDLGTLNDVGKIRTNATKVNVDIAFTDDGSKVKIPEDKKELKKVMASMRRSADSPDSCPACSCAPYTMRGANAHPDGCWIGSGQTCRG